MNRTQWYLCLALSAMCLVIYVQTLTHGFVNYDDGLYVTDNPHVQSGLSWRGTLWAFTTERAMYFHPLTWLSHQLDCQLYGMRPWGHHLTNLLIHTLNSVLLFLVLCRMTGRLWPSAFAAALFAVHPLHVESVAWISERKDVLSTFFWIAAMGCYTEQRRAPGWKWACATAGMFVLGFMSKPMVVTLPFALLLLDLWPFERLEREASLVVQTRRFVRLSWEKVPLMALTVAMCLLTVVMQMRGNNLAFGEKVTFPARCANAIVVYVIYLQKTLWPSGLGVYYPHPIARPALQVAGAAVVLVLISGIALASFRRRPYLLVGWLWYLGTLLPVIELVQAGTFSHADRYTYIPHIGVFMAVAWCLDDWVRGNAQLKSLGTALATGALLVCAVIQCSHWKNSETLFRHAQEVTTDNPVAHINRGAALYDQGRIREAREEYDKTLALDPTYALAIDNIGVLLNDAGEHQAAIAKHREALALNPKLFAAHLNLARALEASGNFVDAIEEFEAARVLRPDAMGVYCGLGGLFVRNGDPEAAKRAFSDALALNPKSKEANLGMADVLNAQGDLPQAAAHYAQALGTGPEDAQGFYNLGAVLQAMGNAKDAGAQYEAALELDPVFPPAHANLAGLLLNAGQFGEAERHARKALSVRPDMVQAQNTLGNALEAQGKFDEAKDAYLAALLVDADYVPARLNLAQLLISRGKPSEAAVHIQRVLEKDPANAGALQLKGRLPAGS